jgi:hypothetical protein
MVYEPQRPNLMKPLISDRLARLTLNLPTAACLLPRVALRLRRRRAFREDGRKRAEERDLGDEGIKVVLDLISVP